MTKLDTIRDVKLRGARRRTRERSKRGVRLMQTHSPAFLAGIFDKHPYRGVKLRKDS